MVMDFFGLSSVSFGSLGVRVVAFLYALRAYILASSYFTAMLVLNSALRSGILCLAGSLIFVLLAAGGVGFRQPFGGCCPGAPWTVKGLLGSIAGLPLTIAGAVSGCSRRLGAGVSASDKALPVGLILVCLYTVENSLGVRTTWGWVHKRLSLYFTHKVSLAGGVVALADDVAAARRHHGVPPRGARREEEWFFYQLLVQGVVERDVVQDALQFVRPQAL